MWRHGWCCFPPEKTWLSLRPFAKRSSAELHVCTFCNGSQWTQILHSPSVPPFSQVFEYMNMSMQTEWKKKYLQQLLFSFSFLLCPRHPVLFSLFHLISSSASLCPNTTGLHVMRWARLSFLVAETRRACGSLEEHRVFFGGSFIPVQIASLEHAFSYSAW